MMEENTIPLTFEQLDMHYRTGRCISTGSGRSKVVTYRSGVQCNAGDLETAQWCSLVRQLIAQEQEQELFQKLSAFMAPRTYVRMSKEEQEVSLLSLYTARIFENPEWCHYKEFQNLLSAG